MTQSLLQAVNKNKKSDANLNAAELIVHYLEHLKIEYVFGIPGGAIEPIYNALAHSEKKGGVRAVNACHESAAAYMADGYYRETGKLGVCVATSGPGATNIITGIACAYENSIPMLVITGQPAIPSFGKGALQESADSGINIVNMFQYCTRYNSFISHQNQLETKLASALLIAHHSKGPAHLSIPVDILRQRIEVKKNPFNLADKIYKKISAIDNHSVNELLSILKTQTDRPVFFIGHGAAEAIDAIMMLVELTGALFVTTPDAKGLINYRHNAYRGVFGLGGHDSAIDTLQLNRGITIAFGSNFGEFSSNRWSETLLNEKLIHIDDTSENLVRSPMAHLHIQGRILTVCNRLIEQLLVSSKQFSVASTPPPANQNINPNIILKEPEKYVSDASPIKPQRLMKELSERFPPNTRFLADAGNSMMWAPHYLHSQNRRERQDYQSSKRQDERRLSKGGSLRLTLNFAPMGWAIGASIGIARGNSNLPTVCITGDGAYLMSGQEITIAAQEKLPVIFVILNDGVYGMVMHGQRISASEPIGFNLRAVNFAKLVEAMDIQSHIIESPNDFDNIKLDKILLHKGPTLLDVRIDKEEVPPMASRLKSLGSIQ